MKINELIYEVSKIFKADETVTIYTYDDKIILYAICFSNFELRKIWRIIQQHHIITTVTGTNANGKVTLSLEVEHDP